MHQQLLVGVDDQAVRYPELARSGAGCPPLAHLLAVAGDHRGFDLNLVAVPLASFTHDVLDGLRERVWHRPIVVGGAGASAREVSVVMEELGRSLAPVPYLASAVFATSVLTASTGPVATDVLRRLVDGAVAAVTVPAIAAPGSSRATVTATRHSIEERVSLSGSVSGVLALDCADVLLVPAGLDDERVVVLVDSHAPGITVHTPVSADLTRPIFDVSLDGVLGDMILRGQDATDALAAPVVRVLQANGRNGSIFIAVPRVVGTASWPQSAGQCRPRCAQCRASSAPRSRQS